MTIDYSERFERLAARVTDLKLPEKTAEVRKAHAVIAALSLPGRSTEEIVTGLRQLMVSMMRPTKEAADQVKMIGLQWDVNAQMETRTEEKP